MEEMNRKWIKFINISWQIVITVMITWLWEKMTRN